MGARVREPFPPVDVLFGEDTLPSANPIERAIMDAPLGSSSKIYTARGRSSRCSSWTAREHTNVKRTEMKQLRRKNCMARC